MCKCEENARVVPDDVITVDLTEQEFTTLTACAILAMSNSYGTSFGQAVGPIVREKLVPAMLKKLA